MQMSMSCDSLRKVRAIAIALSAWLHDCGPTTWSVGQSTHARACAAISIPMSRGCELAPTFGEVVAARDAVHEGARHVRVGVVVVAAAAATAATAAAAAAAAAATAAAAAAATAAITATATPALAAAAAAAALAAAARDGGRRGGRGSASLIAQDCACAQKQGAERAITRQRPPMCGERRAPSRISSRRLRGPIAVDCSVRAHASGGRCSGSRRPQ